MKLRLLVISLASLVTVGFSGLIMLSCKGKPVKDMIIITESAENAGDPDYISGASWRYISGARLLAVDPNNPGKSPKLLTEGFYSACSPDISYDGKYMLFAGQQKEGDVWQIWEIDLRNSSARQITTSGDNCTDPVYLPGNRLLYSKILANDTLKAGYSLYAGNLDGSGMQRITYSPNCYFAASTMHDGRLLTISRQLYPAQEEQLMMVMRPDGTKADMFYKGSENTTLLGRATETTNGKIVFVEADSANPGSGHLVSISYNRPLNSRINLTSGLEGDFLTVAARSSGKYLVTYRRSDTDRYALYEFDPENKVLGQPV